MKNLRTTKKCGSLKSKKGGSRSKKCGSRSKKGGSRSKKGGSRSKKGGSRSNGRGLRKNKTRCGKSGGSIGLDTLGYGWVGSKLNTWPGVKGNKNSITQSNHLPVSPYGVPVGGVNLPYSTYGDKTGNSSIPVSPEKLKLIGGYNYNSPGKSAKRRNSRGRNSRGKKNRQKGGLFFQDIKNFGRYLVKGVEGKIDGARGVSQPVGVMPTDQPYINRDVNVIISDPVNVEKIYRTNSESIAKL
jgi:hypothetical protein